MARILALSFEGAVLENDPFAALYEQVAGADWSLAADALRAGEISAEEFHARVLDLVEVGEDELASRARSAATARPGVIDLVDWAESNNWMPVVISDGYEPIVTALLEDLGLGHLLRHAGRASHRYRWRVRYLSPRGIEVAAGFKASYLRAFRSAGDFVVLAAGSPADREAADGPDVVFAGGDLEPLIARRRERVYPFETLFDIRDSMERESSGWQ